METKKDRIKQIFHKNKGFIIVSVIYLIVAALDIISTLLYNYDVASVLETNPLSKYIGIY